MWDLATHQDLNGARGALITHPQKVMLLNTEVLIDLGIVDLKSVYPSSLMFIFLLHLSRLKENFSWTLTLRWICRGPSVSELPIHGWGHMPERQTNRAQVKKSSWLVKTRKNASHCLLGLSCISEISEMQIMWPACLHKWSLSCFRADLTQASHNYRIALGTGFN